MTIALLSCQDDELNEIIQGIGFTVFLSKTSTVVQMKKRELEFSYWLTLQNRVLNHGFVTITTNPNNAKQFWMPTPRGIKVYKTVLDLTKRNRLFKGPKFTNKQLVDYKENEKHSYMTTKNWLIEKKFIRPIFDAEKNIDRFELTEYAYEFLQTYVDTITKGATYPGPRMLRRIAKFALYSWIVLCIIIIQKLASRRKIAAGK